jgi:hypothetical protein
MRRFPDREELVAAYWQKLASSIESGGAPPHSRTQATNGRLRSRPRLGVRQRSAALRNGKHLSGMHGAIRPHTRFHSHSNS